MIQRFLGQIRNQWMGALALFLVLTGGAAFAAFNPIGLDGDLDLCFEKKTGDLDVKKGKKCGRGEKSFAINQTGPQGPQGPPGPSTGPAGGDLTGVYPDPQIASGAVTQQELGCEGNGGGDEMVKAGTVCIDKFEASVWSERNGGIQLVTGAQIDAFCPDNGQDCKGKIFARSIAGVEPAHNITWFQAQQALANSGKRFPTSAEWQTAVSGTQDTVGADSGPPSCNTDSTLAVAPTGSRTDCVSDWGAFDMVGNLWEWVADWDEESDNCGNWAPPGYGSDTTCFGPPAPGSSHPGALIRGGDFLDVEDAGPFAVESTLRPSDAAGAVGFRGAR